MWEWAKPAEPRAKLTIVSKHNMATQLMFVLFMACTSHRNLCLFPLVSFRLEVIYSCFAAVNVKLVAVGYNHVFDPTVLQLDYEVISRNINHLSRTRKDHAALLILESIVGEDSYILLSRLRGTSPAVRIPPRSDRVYQVNPAHLTVGFPSRSWNRTCLLTERAQAESNSRSAFDSLCPTPPKISTRSKSHKINNIPVDLPRWGACRICPIYIFPEPFYFQAVIR